LLKEVKKENAWAGLYPILAGYLLCAAFILLIFLYLYFTVIRPFEKLNHFAYEVARGNLDSPLYYERKNLFGAFTWAFDNMRREVKKARACEKEAIENNKTVIATISHDIKTPIASIRAYAEGLAANMDSNAERRNRYISVIIKKCDEVSGLTNDLFLHSLSDLDKLKMNPVWCQTGDLIPDILGSIQEESTNIRVMGDLPSAEIFVDPRRLNQVFENLINNSAKYSLDNNIDLFFHLDNTVLTIHIRDYGKGMDEEDLPFAFDKFYRGKNASGKPGSGLGLYIVKYIMEQMNGNVDLKNHPSGLEIILKLPSQNEKNN
jgi:signal transduction histidine kinase